MMPYKRNLGDGKVEGRVEVAEWGREEKKKPELTYDIPAMSLG